MRRQCLVLAVTTTPLAWRGTNQLIAKAPGVQIALGLHPELVATRAGEVDHFCKLVSQAALVGDVGLDGSPPHRAALPKQVHVFRTILQATAATGGRVMTVHSRGAATDVLRELEHHGNPRTAVLHWFSGSCKELERAIELGCWFSVGPAMLNTEKGRRRAAQMPADRVLTETDGPFGKNGYEPLYPWDVADAESVLSTVWNMDGRDVAQRIRENLHSLTSNSTVDVALQRGANNLPLDADEAEFRDGHGTGDSRQEPH